MKIGNRYSFGRGLETPAPPAACDRLRPVLTKAAYGCAAGISLLVIACEEESRSERVPPPGLPERTSIPNVEPSELKIASPSEAAPPDAAGPAFEEFVDLQRRINQLQQALSLKIDKGADPYGARQEFNQQVKAVVQSSSMSPTVYNRFAKRMTSDPEFAEHVLSLVGQKPIVAHPRDLPSEKSGESTKGDTTGNGPAPTEATP